MNKNLKLAHENYKLSQNLVSTKSRNKVLGPSPSRESFTRIPDHKARNSSSSRNQQSLKYHGRKNTYLSRTPHFQKNIKSRRYRQYV